MEGVHGITVTGQGQVSISPDRAVIGFRVSITGKSACEVQKTGDQKMGNLHKVLSEMRVANKDMNTGRYSIQPVYSSSRGNKPSKVTGYNYVNQLAVMVRDLKQLPKTIDVGAKTGAEVTGVTFQADPKETDKKENEALTSAIADAKAKADLIAASTGVALGLPIDISHSSNCQRGGSVLRAASLQSLSFGGSGSDEAAAIRAGDQEISMTATILYRITGQVNPNQG